MISPRFPSINAVMSLHSQTRLHQFAGLIGWHHGHDLALHQVAPVEKPVLQQARVIAFHKLEAAVEIRLDPAADVFQAVRHHAALLAEAAIHRLRIPVAKPLHDHEQHQASSRLTTTEALVPPNPNEFDSTQPSWKLSRRSRTIGLASKGGWGGSMLALSQMKPLFIIRRE